MESSGGQVRERRRSARHSVRDVRGTLHLSAEARIVNMSLTGMAVETNAQLRVGRTYSLSIHHGEDVPLRLSGTVVWCHLRLLRGSDTSETRPVYEAGFSFNEALTDTAADLARILQAAAVVAVEKRISGRFKVDLPEAISLNVTYPFVVKTISAVGILIETELSPAVDTLINFDVDLMDYKLRARGRVAHASPTDDSTGRKTNQVGVEFLELSADDRRAVEDFIGRRLTGVSDALD